MSNATQRVILITGASSGLGRAAAEHLTAHGDRVYGTSRAPADTAPFTLLPLDVTNDASVSAFVAEVMRREGRIDALVNNAGHAFVGAVEETDIEALNDQLAVNVVGAHRMTLAVLPVMRAQGSGRIVNISSLSGVVPFPFLGAYSASKHALEALTEALSFELFGTGVHVSLIEPEGMRTAIAFHLPRADHPDLADRRRAILARLQASTRDDGADPEVLAIALAAILDNAEPPLRTVIGEAASRVMAARRDLPEPEYRAMLVSMLGLDRAPQALST